MLKTTVRPTGEEELDDYVKDLVEITIKMMVSSLNLCKTHKTGDLQKSRCTMRRYTPPNVLEFLCKILPVFSSLPLCLCMVIVNKQYSNEWEWEYEEWEYEEWEWEYEEWVSVHRTMTKTPSCLWRTTEQQCRRSDC